jgi:hypothetical protein
MGFVSTVKLMAQSWKEMPEEEKAEYCAKADASKIEYEAALAAYNNNINHTDDPDNDP